MSTLTCVIDEALPLEYMYDDMYLFVCVNLAE